MKLRVAPATVAYLRQLEATLPHAILLTGPRGIGLATLAKHIASRHGQLLSLVEPSTESGVLPVITVDQIRELYQRSRTIQATTSFIIIDDADKMNRPAQNALLKLLEEPNDSIVFILTTHEPHSILPTIHSRTQQFSVPRISDIEARRLIAGIGITDETAIARLLFVAQGLPALLTRLAQEADSFKKAGEQIQTARQLIVGTSYERFVVASSYSGDRKQALELIEAALFLLHKSLRGQPDSSSLRRLDRFSEAASAIRANGSVKLHLSVAVL